MPIISLRKRLIIKWAKTLVLKIKKRIKPAKKTKTTFKNKKRINPTK